MPEAEIAKRGGAEKWRTVSYKDKKGRKRYIKVAIVPETGPKGGHTVAGKPKTVKGKK